MIRKKIAFYTYIFPSSWVNKCTWDLWKGIKLNVLLFLILFTSVWLNVGPLMLLVR